MQAPHVDALVERGPQLIDVVAKGDLGFVDLLERDDPLRPRASQQSLAQPPPYRRVLDLRRTRSGHAQQFLVIQLLDLRDQSLLRPQVDQPHTDRKQHQQNEP